MLGPFTTASSNPTYERLMLLLPKTENINKAHREKDSKPKIYMKKLSLLIQDTQDVLRSKPGRKA